MATFAFSPNGPQYVKAEMAQISLEFDVNSKIQIYDFNYTDQKLKHEAVFSVSFTACDWGYNDEIVAGTDSGKVLISKVGSLKTTEFKDICDNPITAIKYSPSEDNDIAVGSKTGQFIILDQNGNIRSAATSKTGSPHNAPIKSIKWSNIVTKICCSVDEIGKMIVWNTKQGGAVTSFDMNGEGIDCCFSNTVATIVFILIKGELAVIDLRQKDGLLTRMPMKPNACAINFAEGEKGILSVFHTDGLVESYDTQHIVNTRQLIPVGSQILGQQFSVFYPNIWGSIDEQQPDSPINLRFCTQIINNKPLLFDTRVLQGTLPDDVDDIIQIINKPMCCSSLNVFRYLNQDILLQQQIIDSEELVEQVKTVINGNDRQLDQEAKQFFDNIKLQQNDLLNELIGQQQQSLQDSGTGADFFDVSGSKLNSPGATDQKTLADATEIKNYLLNGRITTALDILSRAGDYANVFYILLILKNIQLQSDKYINKYNNILIKQQNSTENVAENSYNLLAGNQENIDFPSLLTQIANKNFSIEQSGDWKSYMQLIRAYQPEALQSAALQVIQHIEQNLLPQTQDVDRKNLLLDLMKLKLFTGNKQEALHVAQLRQGQLTVKQKLSCAILAREQGLSYLHDEMEKVARIIKSQGQVNLYQSLCEILKIQHQQPYLKQEQCIPREKNHHGQQSYPPISMPTRMPDINRMPAGPFIPNTQPNMKIFVPPTTSTPTTGPITSERSHRTSRTSHAENNATTVTPPFIPSRPIQQPSLIPQPKIFEPPQVPSGPIVATDFGQLNLRPGVPSAPSGPFSPTNEPRGFPAAPGNTIPNYQPLPPVIFPQPVPGNSGAWVPPPSSADPSFSMPKQKDRVLGDINSLNPMATRGGTITAPPPPPGNPNTTGIPQEGYVTMKINTAPKKAPERPKPIQCLPPNARDATCLQTIQLKTSESQTFMQFLNIYSQKDGFGFQRNAPKLGDFLIYISDYAEVPGLFQESTIEAVRRMLEAFGQSRYDEGSRIISEHNKVNTELAPWVSCLKLMSIALKK